MTRFPSARPDPWQEVAAEAALSSDPPPELRSVLSQGLPAARRLLSLAKGLSGGLAEDVVQTAWAEAALEAAACPGLILPAEECYAWLERKVVSIARGESRSERSRKRREREWGKRR